MSRFCSGWLRLDRSLANGDIVENPNTLVLWIWLLMMANIYESSVRFQEKQRKLMPGQILTGIPDLIKITKLSHGAIQRNLAYLEKTGRIHQEVGNKGRIISICKWEEFQMPDKEAVTSWQASDKQAVNERQLIERDNNQQSLFPAQPPAGAAAGPAAPSLEPVHFETGEALLAALPAKTLTRFRALYPDEEFIRRELIRAHGWYTERPRQTPKTVRGWCSALSSWLERGWRFAGKSTKRVVPKGHDPDIVMD